MKRTYKNIILPLLLIFSACTEKSNLDPEGEWTLTDPVLTSPAANASIILNEAKPDSVITITWNAAVSSANYGISYSVVIDTANSTTFDSPILEVKSGHSGKDLSVEIPAKVINEALSFAGYPANATSQLTLAVKASSLSKTSFSSATVSVKRFATEIKPDQLYISGDATENGSDLSKAIPLKRLNGQNQQPSNKFEVYTSLTKDMTYKFYSAKSLPAHQYGGSNGKLVKSGAAITAAESGVFRISLNLDDNTYTLTKINKFSVVGANINGAWNGDEPLDYQGGGVWKKSIELVAKGGFVFRANGDWGFLIKRIKGTTSNLVKESDAASQGVQFEDIPSEEIGTKIVTLDLSAGGYTYKIERDPNATGPITAPATLFLLQGTTKICQFTKNGDVFTSDIYVPLQASATYTLNSAADGTGSSYSLNAKIGETTSPNADKVTGTPTILEGAGAIEVASDQAYQLSLDFAAPKLSWKYYNMKLFHWDPANWNGRNEFVMTYVHPLKFTVTANLTAGYKMKFNSPWDIQFSPDDPSGGLSGTMTNPTPPGADFINFIKESGSYKVTIVVNNDFKTGTYEFVKQ